MNSSNTTNSELPLGLRITDTVITSLFFSFSLGVLVTLILLRNSQPIKFRFFTAVFCTVALCMSQDITRWLDLWVPNLPHYAIPLRNLYLSNPFYIFVAYLVCFEYTRFLTNQYVQAKMNSGEGNRKRVRVLKFFSGWKGLILGLVVLIIEQYTIAAVLTHPTIYSQSIRAVLLPTLETVKAVHLLAFVIIPLTTVIIQLVIDIKKIGFSACYTFCSSSKDPLNYRLDVCIVGCVAVTVFIRISLEQTILLLLGKNGGDYDSGVIGTYVILILARIAERLGLLSCFALTMIATVLKRSLFFVSEDESDVVPNATTGLKALIDDPRGRKLLMSYCMYEFSAENLHAYIAIEKYLQISDKEGDEKLNSAKSIFSEFIKLGSLTEVNIPTSIRDDVLHKLKGIEDGSLPRELLIDLFAEFYMEVTCNLKDSFNRFKTTPKYNKFRRSSIITM